MKLDFQSPAPQNWKADAVLVPCYEGQNPAELFPALDKACPWLAIAPALRDFTGKKNEAAFIYGHPDLPLPRALLLGLGKMEDADVATVREAFANAARKCQSVNLASALLPAEFLEHLPAGQTALVEESVCSFYLGLYKFSELKTREKDASLPLFFLALDEKNEVLLKAAIRGLNSARAIYLARNLDNMPANMLYPEILALRAEELAQKYDFSCEIHNEDSLRHMGAGCLLAIGQGSSHPPRLIILEHKTPACEKDDPIILVGKGLTFDSGGLCLKPATNMGEMKCDMSGAAAVLSAITAAAREKLDRHLVGILACAENMPDGNAFRPGDVVSCLNGETVEVVNTDAEGRLALADALAYARQNWTSKAIIDIATLTGACAIALGRELGGLFCNDDDLARRLAAIGKSCGESLWQLPLWSNYRQSLKSEIADIKHTAEREGGAITAALFLENFVGDAQAWAHLDIAGVDWNNKDKPMCPIGPTGFGARILLELARGGVN